MYSGLEFRALEFNFLTFNELTVAAFANVVFAVEYQLTSGVSCNWISLELGFFPNSVVKSTVLVFCVLNNEFLLRIVDNDICVKTNFDSALAVVDTEQLSRVCSGKLYSSAGYV